MVIRLLSADSDEVDFKVVWNKKAFDVSLSLNEKVLKLKEHMQSLVGMLDRCELCVYKHLSAFIQYYTYLIHLML